METQNSIKAKLALAINLAGTAKNLLDSVCNTLAPSAEDDIFELVNAIQDCERTNIDEIMSDLEKDEYFTNLMDGSEWSIPCVKVTDWLDVSIEKPANGGTLVAYANDVDKESSQAGVYYRPNGTDVIFDLCCAEVKGEGLAVIDGKTADNKDVDVYTYSDIFKEDYTDKFTLKHHDIIEMLVSDSVNNDMEKYHLKKEDVNPEYIESIVKDVISSGKDISEVVENALVALEEKTKEEQHIQLLICEITSWMCEVAKNNEEDWVKEGSHVDDYIAWLYRHVCVEDRNNREWWAGFGFTDEELDNIANDYDFHWMSENEPQESTFLVQRIIDDRTFATIMNPCELVDYINMSDCHNESYDIWDATVPGKVRHCHYKGWQQGCLIEVVRDDDQKLLVSMFGEDH